MSGRRASDPRTAKVIQLYSTPGGAQTPDVAARRQSGKLRHPSQSGADGHPNTDGFGTGPAAVTPISDDARIHNEALGVEHVGPPRPSPLLSLNGLREGVADALIGTAGYLRERLAGEYEVDDFGFDPHFTENVWFPAIRPVYEKWFRVEVSGVENLPVEGGALLVANHAGSIPIDAARCPPLP